MQTQSCNQPKLISKYRVYYNAERIWNSPLNKIRSRLTRLWLIRFHVKLFPCGLITRRRQTNQHRRLHIIPHHLNKFDFPCRLIITFLNEAMNRTNRCIFCTRKAFLFETEIIYFWISYNDWHYTFFSKSLWILWYH